MTEINHNEIKQQMVDILQADSVVYDIDDNTKIVYLEVGEPPGNPLPTTPEFPGMWITNSRPLETITHSGIDTDTGHTILNHDVDYDLKLMVNEQDSIVAEKQLDDLQKVIMESLEADIRFTNNIWDISITFAIDDKVSYQGGLYQSLQDSNTGNVPTDVSFWEFLTRLPNTSFPSRVDTFRQNQDGTAVRGKIITWKVKFTT